MNKNMLISSQLRKLDTIKLKGCFCKNINSRVNDGLRDSIF